MKTLKKILTALNQLLEIQTKIYIQNKAIYEELLRIRNKMK